MKIWRWQFGNQTLSVGAILAAITVTSYAIFIPAVLADNYAFHLDKELADAKTALGRVAGAAGRPVFSDPDIGAMERAEQIRRMARQVAAAEKSLDKLAGSSGLTSLPGITLSGGYQKAKVWQARTASAVAQSRQVLTEYSGYLRYLESYTGLQADLDKILNTVNNVQNFDAITAANNPLHGSARQANTKSLALEELKPPPGLDGLHSAATDTFDRTTTALDRLELGLALNADYIIYPAVAQLEALAFKNQVEDTVLLVATSDNLPILRQLAELPEKIETVREPAS